MGNTYATSINILILLDFGDCGGITIRTDGSELFGRTIDLASDGAINEDVIYLNNGRFNKRNARFRFLAYRNS